MYSAVLGCLGVRKRSSVRRCSTISPSSMKMHSSLARRAWAMLGGTIRMVYRPFSPNISSSMARVAQHTGQWGGGFGYGDHGDGGGGGEVCRGGLGGGAAVAGGGGVYGADRKST